LSRIAILTPNPQDEGFHTRWREVFAAHAATLASCGGDIEGVAWTDEGVDLRAFDLVLPLTAWGYHREPERWVERTRAWDRDGVNVLNPASVQRWNADKGYLGRLAERGAPVIPTVYGDRITPQAMADAAAAFGVERLVAKPRVSASAWRTLRWSPGDPVDKGPDGPALIQPYLPSIEGEGETSLFYFDGVYSHTVGKVAKPGDFRVQPEWGGVISAVEPAADQRAAAEAILAAVEEPLLYARIDLVRDLDGRPALIELELIEPDLYLTYDPAGGAGFARAVRRALDAVPA